jgi:hypothetical protein
MGMICTVILFGLSILAASILGISTWVIQHQFRDKLGKVYVDISSMLPQRIGLNISVVLLLLLEDATLFWDNLTPYQFPQAIRWPIDMIVSAVVAFCGLRLFSLYVKTYRKLPTIGTCPYTGVHCPVPQDALREEPHLTVVDCPSQLVMIENLKGTTQKSLHN